jgi:hypothetical protein
MTRPPNKSSLLRNDAVLSALAALLLACVVCAAIYRERHPAPPVKDEDPSSFNTARALAHLSHVAAEPHPSNSAAHERVRNYIVGELSKQGLQPEIQTTPGNTSVDSRGRPSGAAQPGGAGQVKNIVARLAGSEPEGRALMLAAHYDSVEGSPGASDDGAGVATLLETLRALRAEGSPQLKRDVVFLFTDGEESGLLGAKAFVAEHALAKRIGLVLNFEARGTCGTVYMFETSERNDALIAGFAEAAPRPFASSLAYTIYKLLPNDTDLTVFKRAGMAGLNFAYLGCAANYHSGSDNVANLDEDSLRHMGSYALPLARHFGNSQLDFSGARPAVYFDLFGFGLVHYPQAWVMPLAVGTALLFALVFYYGLRTKQLTVRGTAVGFFGLLFGVVCAFVVATIFRAMLSLVGVGEGHAGDELLALCVIILSLLLVAVIYLRLLKWASAASLSAGSLLWWLILTLSLSRDFPGASYVFMWPLLFGLLALALLLAAGASKMHPFALMLAFGVLTFPAVALLTRTLDGFVQALGLRMPIVLVALVVLTFALLVPFLTFMPGGRISARADRFPATDP